MLNHLNITLYGTVQGVFLRRTVEKVANQIGVFGFIKNEPDSTVYIEAEADAEILQKFVDWLKAGAGEGDYKIAQVETAPGTFKAFDKFEIK